MSPLGIVRDSGPAVMTLIMIVIVMAVIITLIGGFGYYILVEINQTLAKTGQGIPQTYNFLAPISAFFTPIATLIGIMIIVSVIAVVILLLVAIAKKMSEEGQSLFAIGGGGAGY